MDLVSLSGHLTSTVLAPADYIRYLQLLLQGISLHAIESDPEALCRFRNEILLIADALNADASAEDLALNVGKALRALEEYNQSAAGSLSGHASELRSMLAMMTQTVAFLSSSNQTSVTQLSLIEKKLQRASTLEDVRQLRGQMADCLTVVRSESSRLQAESRARLESLQAEVERVSSRLRMGGLDSSSDPITGLPMRALAEQAIAAKISSKKECVAALFVIDRLASINGRFGRAAGDDVLLLVAQQLAKRLSGATLFRWSGPALAAILEAVTGEATAESQAKAAASMRLEKTIETNGRSVFLLITLFGQVRRVSSADSVDAVCADFDQFQAAHF
ncbi:MAG TPA: diguanylate cyclase [Bryobacteraceae bacterium]